MQSRSAAVPLFGITRDIVDGEEKTADDPETTSTSSDDRVANTSEHGERQGGR